MYNPPDNPIEQSDIGTARQSRDREHADNIFPPVVAPELHPVTAILLPKIMKFPHWATSDKRKT